MVAKYLIRLDDACDTSNFSKWREIERILDTFSVKPIVAVIPNNRDQSLFYGPKNPNFWNLVRTWESKKWAVAMHGLNHVYHNVDRKRLILPFYDRSEFAGLPLEKQRERIRRSLAIFRENKIEPRLWVAPSHSFDAVTLEALNLEVSFRIISDGIALRPYTESEFTFIPQQLWDVSHKKSGTWTICLHPDTMSFEEIDLLASKLSKNEIKENLINIDQIQCAGTSKRLIDRLYAFAFWLKYDIRLKAKKFMINNDELRD